MMSYWDMIGQGCAIALMAVGATAIVYAVLFFVENLRKRKRKNQKIHRSGSRVEWLPDGNFRTHLDKDDLAIVAEYRRQK